MSITDLADTGLPFNRKERFFTGTVLPMLVCAHDFAHFDRLTELVGLGKIAVDARPDLANDIATGAWRAHRYECSSKPVGNVNWFPVAAFIAKIKERLPPSG